MWIPAFAGMTQVFRRQHQLLKFDGYMSLFGSRRQGWEGKRTPFLSPLLARCPCCVTAQKRSRNPYSGKRDLSPLTPILSIGLLVVASIHNTVNDALACLLSARFWAFFFIKFMHTISQIFIFKPPQVTVGKKL